jgi:hypothetical protein
MASAIKLNYNCKALASVVNYDHKRDATMWCVSLTSSFTIIIGLSYRPNGTAHFKKM